MECSGTAFEAGDGADDELAARQALADIVVRLAFEDERHARREPRAEALARGALQVHGDRVVGQALVAVALGDLAGQHGARPCGRSCGPSASMVTGFAGFQRGAGLRDERAVEHVGDGMHLTLACDGSRRSGPASGLWKMRVKSRPFAFQWSMAVVLVEEVGLADHLVEGAEAHRGHQLAHFLGDEEEVVDHVLRQALEALAQHRVLRRDADRAGVEMALAHHDAAGRDQRRGREAVLVGAEQAPRSPRRVPCAGRRRPGWRRGRAGGSARGSAASRRGRSPTANPHA